MEHGREPVDRGMNVVWTASGGKLASCKLKPKKRKK
jgi:hypothetical protein